MVMAVGPLSTHSLWSHARPDCEEDKYPPAGKQNTYLYIYIYIVCLLFILILLVFWRERMNSNSNSNTVIVCVCVIYIYVCRIEKYIIIVWTVKRGKIVIVVLLIRWLFVFIYIFWICVGTRRCSECSDERQWILCLSQCWCLPFLTQLLVGLLLLLLIHMGYHHVLIY